MVRNLTSLILPLITLLLSWLLFSKVLQLSAAHRELLTLTPYLLATVAFAHLPGISNAAGFVC